MAENPVSAPMEQLVQPVRIVNFRSLVLWSLAIYLVYHVIDLIAVTLLLFGLAFFLAIILDPPIRRLDRRGLSRGWSVAVIAVLFFTALGAVAALGIPPLVREGTDLVRNAPRYYEQLQQRVQVLFPALAEQLEQIDPQQKLTELGQSVLPRIGRISLGILGGLFSFFVIIVLTLYTLADPGPLVRGAIRAAPRQYRHLVFRIIVRISLQLQAWVRATFWMMLIIGVMCGVGLWALGVKGAFLFGVIAGIGEAIPTIGPILSAIPPIVVTVATDPVKAVWIAVLFLVIQQVENNLLVPRIMSATMNLHPVSVLFFVIAMGGLMGPLGILLATPLCAITKVLYEEIYRRRIQGHSTRVPRMDAESGLAAAAPEGE